MKTEIEILKPYIERPFRHTEIVEKDNAIQAMKEFADQFKSEESLTAIILEFKKWYDKLSPADKCTVWAPDGSMKGLFNMNDETIVEKFFKTQPK